MSYKIKTIPRFEKDVKRLKKRFPKIKEDLNNLIYDLQENPKIGTSLGDNIYKIRIPNSSIPTGKSGGFRLITYYELESVIYLITMYSKSEKDTILTNKLKEIISKEL